MAGVIQVKMFQNAFSGVELAVKFFYANLLYVFS